MDLDTNWCPVCDRLIPPERITIPVAPEVDIVAKTASDATPKPKLAARPPMLRRHTTNHTRSNSKANAPASKPTGVDLLNTQVATAAVPKPRTIISQAPSALYCSESCREKDQLSSERFQLSLETMFSAGPSSASSLSSPLLVSGSESDVDGDLVTNESYFAQLRVGGRTGHQGSSPAHDKTSWSNSQLGGKSATATTSSSEDLPAINPVAKAHPPPPVTTSSHRRPLSYSHTPSLSSTRDVNASLYAAYPLTFHRTRSGEGSARSRKGSHASLSGINVDSLQLQETSAVPTEVPIKSEDVTPTQSLYGIDSVSAQGLLVRPAMLRSKSERTGITPLSPISPAASDSAPRLYPPQYPSSLPASKFGFTQMSTPTSPSGSRSSSRRPSKGEVLRPRRRSDNISEEVLTEASRVKSCEQLAGQKSPFLPMYPTLMPAPCTRVVQKIVLELGEDGVERMVQKEVIEEYYEERKRQVIDFDTY